MTMHPTSSGTVPHSDSLVITAADQLVVTGGVHHLLDTPSVALKLDDRVTRLLQIKYPTIK